MIFEQSPCPIKDKLGNFAKYVNRKEIARFMVRYDIFRRQLNIKGSIVECGVHHGGGLLSWAKISTILEPYNYHRKIFGFDTFSGFPDVADIDILNKEVKVGMFGEKYDVHSELTDCIKEYDETRYINHIDKVVLIKGDANETIPTFLEKNQYLLISLLYLDFDIYKPTLTALKHLVPRIPKGGIIAFDEVNNEHWAGETRALLESLNINHYKLECFEYEPNISFIQL